MAPSASFLTVRKTLVEPASGRANPPIRVPLSGCDLIYDGFHIKFSYFFPEVLNPQLLKQSLAQALDAFPIMAGRARKEGSAHWIDCSGAGAVVREQVARISGTDGLVHGETGPFMAQFAKGPFNTVANDPDSPILVVTLTEITYGEAFSCRPAAACRCADGSRSVDESSDASSSSGLSSSSGSRAGVIRYALGVSFSHTAADGCAAACFLATWARAGGGLAIQPAVNARGLLLDEGPLDAERHPPPPKFRLVSTLGRSRVMAAFALNQLRCETVVLRFDRGEVEAIKAKASAPLEGTGKWVSTSNALAAHLWPILSDLLLGRTHKHKHANKHKHKHTHNPSSSSSSSSSSSPALVPLSVVVNSRRQLGIPLHYCGNVVSIQDALEATDADSLTERALKVRLASSPSSEEAQRDHYYMQRVKSYGRSRNLMYRRMRDMCLGRPGLIWDDISSFQMPKEAATFAGATPVAADLFAFIIPGMMFVAPPPPSADPGGKEVRIGLPAHLARRLRGSEMQARIHMYKPWPSAVSSPAPPAAATTTTMNGTADKQQQEKEGEETKEEERASGAKSLEGRKTVH